MSRASGTGPGESVEFRDGKGVAGADALRGPGRGRAAAVGAGQSLVQVDPVGGDAESGEGLALGDEVLGVGGAAGVADQRGGHVRQRTDRPPTSETITGRAI